MANGRAGAPQYNLVKGNILKHIVDAIVVSTGFEMEYDYMEARGSGRVSRRMLQWINMTYPRDAPNGDGRPLGPSLTRAYNDQMYVDGPSGGLLTGKVLDTTGKQKYSILHHCSVSSGRADS
jgi:hypothetical protein